LTRESEFLSKILPIIKKNGGRNVVQIARALDLPVETTRYKIKRMLKNGIGIHANIDYGKIELAKTIGIIRLSPLVKGSERELFDGLANVAYLSEEAKTIPKGSHICTFTVPLRRRIEFNKTVRGLMEAELFETVEFYEMSWAKEHMLRTQFYDYDESQWNVDWARLKKEHGQGLQVYESTTETSDGTRYDYIDLFVLKELQQDAQVSLADVARKSKTTLNNIFYHFHSHVNKRKLVSSYLLQWEADKESKPSKGREARLHLGFVFKNLTHDESKTAISAMNRLPFLRADAYSIEHRVYYAEAVLPLRHYPGLLSFLGETLETISEKFEIYTMDKEINRHYPLPIWLYSSSGWNLEPETALTRIRQGLKS
jgi:DNA-binding Lrp family transcriptional regulator